MTFMESLIGMNFIRYVGSNMQRIIMETIYLAGSSPDWQGYELPESVYSSAHQMLLTLSNIHNLNNIQSFGNTQGDQLTGDVADFLAGMSFTLFCSMFYSLGYGARCDSLDIRHDHSSLWTY